MDKGDTVSSIESAPEQVHLKIAEQEQNVSVKKQDEAVIQNNSVAGKESGESSQEDEILPQSSDQNPTQKSPLEAVSYTQYEQGQDNATQGWGWGSLTESLTKSVLQDTKQFGGAISKAFNEIVNVGQEDSQRIIQKKGDDEGAVDGDDDIDFDEELRKLEGSGGDNSSLEVGLKAIDQQVENLAGGAVKAFGSIWGGFSGALKMGHQLADDTLKELKPMQKVKQAQQFGSKLVTQAEKGLEEIGKQMMADMDTEDDQQVDQNQQIEKEEVSFDSCFYIYGGQQFFEDLEYLSNDCARTCNKSRALMTEQQKKDLESKIAKLGEIFDLDKEANEGTQAYSKNEALGRAYEPLAHLCKKSVEAAKEMYDKLCAEVQQQGEIQSETDQSSSLGLINDRGVKLLSELCSAGVDRLLTLGKSINAHFRLKEESSDGIEWPEDSVLMANLLRGQVKQLLTDCATVGSAFIKTVTNAGKLLELNEQASQLASNLDIDRDTAAQKLRDGFRNLMFVVMIKDIPIQQLSEDTLQPATENVTQE